MRQADIQISHFDTQLKLQILPVDMNKPELSILDILKFDMFKALIQI